MDALGLKTHRVRPKGGPSHPGSSFMFPSYRSGRAINLDGGWSLRVATGKTDLRLLAWRMTRAAEGVDVRAPFKNAE